MAFQHIHVNCDVWILTEEKKIKHTDSHSSKSNLNHINTLLKNPWVIEFYLIFVDQVTIGLLKCDNSNNLNNSNSVCLLTKYFDLHNVHACCMSRTLYTAVGLQESSI